VLLLALCFPGVMILFLLVMARFEALVFPARPDAGNPAPPGPRAETEAPVLAAQPSVLAA
jgi:hypothetical protein